MLATRKVEKLLSIKWLPDFHLAEQTCPRSLDTTSSTVVKLSEGGIRRRPTSQFRDENKKLGEKTFQTAKTESDSMNDCFLVSFLASTNGFPEHCLL